MPFTKRGFLKFSEIIILVVIFTAGLFLYFYKLDSVPSGFYIDEASPGNNAYSILLTGKDEYGKSAPILFRFQGLYAPPVYTYLTTIPVRLLGLNVFSVRVASSLAGLMSMFVVYVLLKTCGVIRERATPFLGALFFVISPWIILHSRFGYEATTAYLIFSIGVLLLWLGLNKERLIVLGFGLLSLSSYAAHTERFLAPLFIIGYLFVFKSRLFQIQHKRYVKLGLVTALFIQIPYFLIFSTPAFFPKSGLINVGGILAQAEKANVLMPYQFALILSYLREFLSQFFGYFSPRSLFFLPDPDPQRSIPELSVFYFWMIVPYLVGIYALWRQRRKVFSRFVFLLALVSPIPASFAKDPFSTYRALPLLLPLILVISIGVGRIIQSLPKKVWVSGFGFLLVLSLLLLWRSYFVFLPKERAKVWGYGFSQLADQIKRRPKEKFVIDQSRIKPAYIELAFFLKYPPEKFQQQVDQKIKENYYTDIKFNPEYNFANIETRTINWEEDIYRDQILVGDELAISEGQANEHFLTKVFEIRSPVDEIIFQGYKTNPARKCVRAPDNVHCKNEGEL